MHRIFLRNTEEGRTDEALSRISIISFTRQGCDLSRMLAKQLEGEETRLYTKCALAEKEEGITYVEERIGQWAGRQMKEQNTLLFIGACGIAVRAIAPHVTDKIHDSPVLVMDENGQYVIPILSGHVGGANEIAQVIGAGTGAVPVITTATDLHHVFAVDVFARKNHFHIVNPRGIAKVSSGLLSGRKIVVSVESGHLPEKLCLPEGVELAQYPPKKKVDIVISSAEAFSSEEMQKASLWLAPKEYAIGMGCRKGKEADAIDAFISQALEASGIFVWQVKALATITLKAREEGLISWSRKQRIPFMTYTPEELEGVEGSTHPSQFVKAVTGVDNVCERAALKAAGSGGKLVYEKHGRDGMTLAIAKGNWSVRFDET